MTKNPCISGRTPDETFCPHIDEDKNFPRCVDCNPRIEYAVAQGMLPKEALEPKKEDPVIQEARKMVVKKKKKCNCEPGCTRKVKARGLCERAYTRWKRKHPDKLRHYSRIAKGETVKWFDVRLQAHVDADADKYELLEKTSDIARQKFRTIQNQIFFWIKQGIERMEGES